MENKTSPSGYHHQRAPRTPESYFNVPESIALLNIVKSERIQSAFQSNRKNHASVWEMVAEVLNRYSARKRSAKQCCNRYENLKKIYTQLKKNPERHVRRNWPYMILFKEIEEQRGECWGSNGKRLTLITKTHKELSYYHRRRQATELGLLLNKVEPGQQQHSMHSQHHQLHGLLPPPNALNHSTDSNSNNSKMERFLPNHFVEAQLNEGPDMYDDEVGSQTPSSPPPLLSAAATAAAAAQLQMQVQHVLRKGMHDLNTNGHGHGHGNPHAHLNGNMVNGNHLMEAATNLLNGVISESNALKNSVPTNYDKESVHENHHDAPLNLQTSENNLMMKSEPMSEGEFNPDDIQLMQTNYNGSQNYYPHNIDTNILHPDVIVDTDNLSDCSSTSLKSKRKLSTSTDGEDSTNYELIEYLKRREKRDEELLKRMDAREERLLNLFERTVVAIEALAKRKCNHQTVDEESSSVSNNHNHNNNNNTNNNNIDSNENIETKS